MTPLIEPSFGQYSPVLVCHRILFRSFVKSTIACEHACGSTTGCARGGSLWNKAVVKVVCSPFLFNIFFAAVISVASTRFKAGKGVMDALVHLRKKRGAGVRGEATAGESVLAKPLWGMLYADDAEVVSQSPEQLRKMMGVSWSCARRLSSPYGRPRLRSCVYARRGCRSPPPYSA